ncbi:hypothetical protein PIB30_040345 [Stylosanthes scabra]|uniref:Agenet domain-containing protein n=1 Tax=Stylosanthes scabra TaxID=79078 RepID=A0ABU6UDV1_9FABA|nr:hypothetical protein [Stylosanthes scabra]
MTPPPNRRVTFRRGSKVEVIGKEEGFFGSYYEATIVTCLGMGCYVVQYENLLDDNGLKPLLEVVKLKDLRPIPPNNDANLDGFEVNQRVDVYHNEGLTWNGSTGPGHIKTAQLNNEGGVGFLKINK